jgi:hypothetical protein
MKGMALERGALASIGSHAKSFVCQNSLHSSATDATIANVRDETI